MNAFFIRSSVRSARAVMRLGDGLKPDSRLIQIRLAHARDKSAALNRAIGSAARTGAV